MEPLVWMLVGAGGVAVLIALRLAARHGWAWVRAQLKARASAVETECKAKVAAAAGDLGARLAKVESDVAALKAKVP